MEFNVKGISFRKDELSTITMQEIEINTISRSHFFFIPASGKTAILLLKAGDFVEQEFVDKYVERGMESIYQLEIAHPNDSQIFTKYLNALENANNERDRRLAKDQILKVFADFYWKDSQKSFLSFAIATFDQYYALPSEVVDKYQASSLVLYSRALLSSAISVATSLISGMVDPMFLKDIYNASYLMDYGLLESSDFNYVLSLACEEERNKPGEGIDILEAHHRSKEDINIFNDHPHLGADYAQLHKEIFFYPEIAEVIRFHHEKVDGSGFPEGLCYSALADTETTLIFSDYMVPYNEHIFKLGDGKIVIKEAFEKLKNGPNIFLLPLNKHFANWQRVMSWAIEKENIVIKSENQTGEAA